jgi:L-threonylcarbamoyladenylate synthase
MDKGSSGSKRTLLLRSDEKCVAKAARILRLGGLVAFPTETVYGLGASVTEQASLARIFAVKGRPADNPLIVHVAERAQVSLVAAAVPVRASCLMDYFWPGPLSLVLPRNPAISDLISAGLPTVAVRMPDHPVALRLISAAGVAVAAPSANCSGRPSPTTARHVLADLGGRIDAVIDGGPCSVGVESTVLDLTGERAVILRPGGVSREAISRALGEPVETVRWSGTTAPPSPGMKYRHYAPRVPLILITGSPPRRAGLIRSLSRYYEKMGMPVGLLSQSGSSAVEASRLARSLYLALRAFELQGVRLILVEEIPDRGLGAAVMNRLRKAASRVIKV